MFASAGRPSQRSLPMRFASLGTFALVTCGAFALAGTSGCESNNKDQDSGRVSNRNQTQHTNPDGTQVRERTQVRETPEGQTVRETETQTRQPVSPGAAQ